MYPFLTILFLTLSFGAIASPPDGAPDVAPPAPGSAAPGTAGALASAIPERDGAWIDPFITPETRAVFVGEEIHGVGEHLTLKGEVARRLIERHGFTHVLIEDDPYKALALDAALRTGTIRDITDAWSEFYWCWNVLEMRDAYRSLQSVAPGSRRPILDGFDVQSHAGAIGSLASKTLFAKDKYRVDLLRMLMHAENPDEEKIAHMLDSLAFTLEESPEIDATREIDHLRHVLRVRRGADTPSRMQAREEGMAETLASILQSDPDAKVVVFAHNAHAGYVPFYQSFIPGGVRPLGLRLRDDYRVPTLSIGVVFTRGEVLVDPREREKNGGPIRVYGEPAPDTQAATWATIPHERWLIDLRKTRGSAAPGASFWSTPPAGHFENYGPARRLDECYDLLVGYSTVNAARPR